MRGYLMLYDDWKLDNNEPSPAEALRFREEENIHIAICDAANSVNIDADSNFESDGLYFSFRGTCKPRELPGKLAEMAKRIGDEIR